MCKSCEAKLSPFFTGRRHTSLESIKEQLVYREENKDEVAAFTVTRTLGKSKKVLIDEAAKKFMVTSAKDIQAENPDVMSFSDITGCTVDTDESRYEEKTKDDDGNPWFVIHALFPDAASITEDGLTAAVASALEDVDLEDAGIIEL